VANPGAFNRRHLGRLQSLARRSSDIFLNIKAGTSDICTSTAVNVALTPFTFDFFTSTLTTHAIQNILKISGIPFYDTTQIIGTTVED
jgi:hypothetical protein